MPRVIVTAEVEDPRKWEEAFRTHGDLFRKQTTTSVHFATEGNEVVICFEMEDVDKYMEIMDSDATAEAMAFDGVKRETVRIVPLDKEFMP